MANGIRPGFVIAPFDLTSDIPVTIEHLSPAQWSDFKKILNSDNVSKHKYPLPNNATSKKEHADIVGKIVKELDGDCRKKTVAAKIICSNDKIDIKSSFTSLCLNFPESFIFLFYTPRSGAWLGASPEILLQSENGKLLTYALAGTRTAGTTGNWDQKNILEQKIVKDYIIERFSLWNMKVKCSELKTRKAGNVEHILTEIQAMIPDKDYIFSTESCYEDSSVSTQRFISFLSSFSPTPALCGMPKDESLERISRLERFCRGYYGGFCGPMISTGNFYFYVNLRSIRFNKDKWCMFVGGGITSRSTADAEWLETERKAEGIIKNLHFLSQ